MLGVNDLIPQRQIQRIDPTQLQLLQSRNFQIQVIENYGLLPAARRRSNTGATGEDTGETAAAEIEVEAEVGLFERGRDLIGRGMARLRAAMAPTQGNLESPSMLADHMRNDRYRGALARFRAMKLLPIEGTNLVQINWTGRDRVFATRMANAVAAEFVEYTRTNQTEMSADASDFLTQEIGRLQGEIQLDEDERTNIARQLGITDLAAASLDGRGNNPLSGQLAAARADRVQKESIYRQFQNSEPGALAEVRNSDGVRSARTEVTRIEDRLETESKRLTTEHPTIKGLQADLSQGREDLQGEERVAYDAVVLSARNSFDAAVRAENRLQDMVANQRGRSGQEADQYARLNVLRTSIANKRRVLQQFIDQRENMDVSSRLYGMRGSTARVVDWATLPRVPSGQPLRQVLLYYALAGLAVGCVLALGLDFLDNTLRTADDVTRRIGLPTLGSVAAMETAGNRGRGYYSSYSSYSSESATLDTTLPAELVAHQQPRSALAEAYRELRTSLLLSAAGGAPRRLLLTSSQPGEGKTTTTCNLATSLAHAGKEGVVDRRRHAPSATGQDLRKRRCPGPRQLPGRQRTVAGIDPRHRDRKPLATAQRAGSAESGRTLRGQPLRAVIDRSVGQLRPDSRRLASNRAGCRWADPGPAR